MSALFAAEDWGVRVVVGAGRHWHRLVPLAELARSVANATMHAWEAERPMPVISMFYGIIVMMYFFDDKQHHMHTYTWNTARNPQYWQSRRERC